VENLMQLILWRHAEAEEGGPGKADTDRALTKKGHKQADRMAAWLRPRVDKHWRILVSPARRTLQTVEPLGLPFAEAEAVGLAADARSVLRAAEWPRSKLDVIVVGHQPTLGEVASLLLGSTEGLAMKKGAIWWFAARDREGEAETVLKIVMSAEEAAEGAE
jgi:phosphohistidine phosphatase